LLAYDRTDSSVALTGNLNLTALYSSRPKLQLADAC